MIHDAAAQIAGIGVLAIICQWLGWRLKLPAIVFLLIAGMIAGPVTGWLQPDALFGDLLFPLVSLCVAVILFEGSLPVLRYRSEFGDGDIYALHANRAEQPEILRIAAAQPGHELFGKDITYSDLNKRLDSGAVVTIDFGEDEDLDTFTARNPDAIPMFAVDTKGKVRVFTSTSRPSMSQGWKLIAISAMFVNHDST